ncbi:uncharacterized protein LOC141713760 [Apium graveolens]|uniref:uncharacterized protein LOC141713760 n=1 Tax=Apium graveolens TaxID=4045 RepID=UPI003D7A584A
MGFNSWWTHLIMQCISTVEYTINHGGYEMGHITPSRGLRQGDPLSPYLFIICAEGLSSLIRSYERRNWLQGLKSASKLLQSVICFSQMTAIYSVKMRVSICQEMQISQADEHTKYLGLPNILGRNKSVILGYLKEKVKASIQSWNEKNIVKPSKELLLKTVAQSLSTFAMNVFLLPSELIKEVEREMAKFFWSSSNKANSRINWMSWENMSKHKHVGGLGFKSLRDFNMAMLGKQCWRLITNPDSLVARVYKARYYANEEFINTKLGYSPSFIWRSILEAKRVIAAGSCWRIGNGKDINIRLQPWLGNADNPYITTESPSIDNEKIAALMQLDAKTWDVKIIQDIFNDRDQGCIINTRIEQDLEKDVGVLSRMATTLFVVLTDCYNHKMEGGVIVQTQNSGKQFGTLKLLLRCWSIFCPNVDERTNTEFGYWPERNVTGQPPADKARMVTLCDGVLYWARPRQNNVKITVDAAVFTDQGASGIGAVARDHAGDMLGART